MNVAGKVAVVTGGGGGIGSAVAIALVQHGAKVAVVDIAADAARSVAGKLNEVCPGCAVSIGADIAMTNDIQRVIDVAHSTFGPVDLYFANAGVAGGVGLEDDEAKWTSAIEINLLAHVRAARLLVPQWVQRGAGYFIATASAAGLLTELGTAPYTVTKHAAVGFAEWLSITYGDDGVRVSCLCPMGVNTAMLHPGKSSGDAVRDLGLRAVTEAGRVLEPATVADIVMWAIANEHFLILPHPQVLGMYRRKASDYDRWLGGMRRYRRRLIESDRR